jgi:hypothetical protein
VKGVCSDGPFQSFWLLPILFQEGSVEKQGEESIKWKIKLCEAILGICYAILLIY